MTALDDFFALAYDAVEKKCLCLICRKKSSDKDTGFWVVDGRLWVCSDDIQEHQDRQIEESE